VLALAQRLPDTSLTVALASGGREHFGWGTDRHLTADLFDAMNQNTRASGQWGKKGPPEIKPWPRPTPKDATPEQKKPVSVADIYKRLQGR
jgi:hypothetical protein